jgi:hypothetical protein
MRAQVVETPVPSVPPKKSLEALVGKLGRPVAQQRPRNDVFSDLEIHGSIPYKVLNSLNGLV